MEGCLGCRPSPRPAPDHADRRLAYCPNREGQGRIAAVYRGALAIDRLVDDVRRLDQPRPATRFAGRWFARPDPHKIGPLAWSLFDDGYITEAIVYVEQHKPRLKRESPSEYLRLLTKRGTELMKRRAHRLAVGQFQEVLGLDPNQLNALNNLAWLLASASTKYEVGSRPITS